MRPIAGIWLKLKGCIRYIFASLSFQSKEEHLSNKEKCFLFHIKSSFEKESEEVCKLIWTNFDSFAVTYLM